ncbi:hypothetical protein [Hugenholtzia roseola]|uniref:hypothetical protein n=1 Tax=Hugenholtzia roseola TaxID=1002 RepID=UPI00040940E8|nr:hypothetical protein [Hugenholtzia roseola]
MFGFIKLPKYRRFEFQPRYYDPEKEAREKRLMELKHQNPEFWDEVAQETTEGVANSDNRPSDYTQNSNLRGAFSAARQAKKKQKGSLFEGVLPLVMLGLMALSLWGLLTDSAENFYHYTVLLGVGFVGFIWLRVRSSLK